MSKRILSLGLVLALVCSLCIIPQKKVQAATYYYSLYERYGPGNDHAMFSLPIYVTNVTVSGSMTYDDGRIEYRTVVVGNNYFTIKTDGKFRFLGNANVNPQYPVPIDIYGMTAPCQLHFEVYTP